MSNIGEQIFNPIKGFLNFFRFQANLGIALSHDSAPSEN